MHAPLQGGAQRSSCIGDYLARTRKLDAELGTPPETKGPFELELRTYGQDGRVIMPVVWAFGDMSSDVYAIIDLVASILTHEHLSCYSREPFLYPRSKACSSRASTSRSAFRLTSAGLGF